MLLSARVAQSMNNYGWIKKFIYDTLNHMTREIFYKIIFSHVNILDMSQMLLWILKLCVSLFWANHIRCKV